MQKPSLLVKNQRTSGGKDMIMVYLTYLLTCLNILKITLIFVVGLFDIENNTIYYHKWSRMSIRYNPFEIELIIYHLSD